MQWRRSKKQDADLERELLSDLKCEEEEQPAFPDPLRALLVTYLRVW